MVTNVAQSVVLMLRDVLGVWDVLFGREMLIIESLLLIDARHLGEGRADLRVAHDVKEMEAKPGPSDLVEEC